MTKSLKGRVAIIGGASKGLGFGCAMALADLGADLVITGRNPDKLEASAAMLEKQGVQVLAIVADMADRKANEEIIQKTIERFGRIDVLVNNSGGPAAGRYKEFSEEDWQAAFQGVLMYNIRMTTHAVEYMKKNNWGRVINITSLSVKEPAEALVLSNVFRAGVVAFSKSIAKELIRSSITINNICPGAFKTDRASQLVQAAAASAGKTPAEVETENVKKLPLGRYQEPSELGAYVAFLCTEAAGGITGTSLQIDGGISNSLL